MPEATTLQLVSDTKTGLIVSEGQTYVSVFSNSEATIIQAVPVNIVSPNFIASDLDPLELADTASPGISEEVARADHVHPSTGHNINGGIF